MQNSPVTQIKERLTIEDVVSSYIKLEHVGSSIKARCPFHNEKTPSFFISSERGSYYCFGCGAKGDIFSFVQEFEGLDFKGALKVLAERAGVTLGTFNKEEESEKEKLYRIMEEASSFFEGNLKVEPEVNSYLKSRGLNDKSIEDFRIGYIKNDWRILYDYLRTKGFNDSEIEKAGLAKKTDKGMYDRFRGRVMFPIEDSSGRVIAFSGRLYVDDGKSAKYLNSPETPIFNKSSVFFGINKAKDAIRKNNFVILVEGQFDLILAHQSGYKNTLASSGTALSDVTISKENAVSNLGLVRRMTENIVLAYDADKAGISATSRAGKIALSLGMDVKVASLIEGMDPADLIAKEGVEAWRLAIKNSKHLIEFVLGRSLKDAGGDTRKAGRIIKEKVLPYVASINSAIEKIHFIKKISDISGIPEHALKDDLAQVEQETKNERKSIENIEIAQKEIVRRDYIERRIIGIILWQKGKKEHNIEVDKVLSELAQILNKDKDKILEDMQAQKEDLIYEAEVFYDSRNDLNKDVGELLINLKQEYLQEELSRKMRELYIAEDAKDKDKITEILKECQIISNKIQEIKNEKNKN